MTNYTLTASGDIDVTKAIERMCKVHRHAFISFQSQLIILCLGSIPE